LAHTDVSTAKKDHSRLVSEQINSQIRKFLWFAFRPAKLNRYVATFNIPSLLKAIAKRLHEVCVRRKRSSADKSQNRQWGLLRGCYERPGCRASNERNELSTSEIVRSVLRDPIKNSRLGVENQIFN
jgi:hypothetical protein